MSNPVLVQNTLSSQVGAFINDVQVKMDAQGEEGKVEVLVSGRVLGIIRREKKLRGYNKVKINGVRVRAVDAEFAVRSKRPNTKVVILQDRRTVKTFHVLFGDVTPEEAELYHTLRDDGVSHDEALDCAKVCAR